MFICNIQFRSSLKLWFNIFVPFPFNFCLLNLHSNAIRKTLPYQKLSQCKCSAESARPVSGNRAWQTISSLPLHTVGSFLLHPWMMADNLVQPIYKNSLIVLGLSQIEFFKLNTKLIDHHRLGLWANIFTKCTFWLADEETMIDSGT